MATACADLKNYITVCSQTMRKDGMRGNALIFHAFIPSIALSKVVKSVNESFKSTGYIPSKQRFLVHGVEFV